MRFAPNNESQVWQCVSKRGTCRRLVQHAACKLLVSSAISNKDLDDGGQTLREGNESLFFLLEVVWSRMGTPLGGHPPNAAEHGLR